MNSVILVQMARLGDLAQTWPLIYRLRLGGIRVKLVVEEGLLPLALLMAGGENVLGIDSASLRRASAKDFSLVEFEQLHKRLGSFRADCVINLNFHPAVAALAEILGAPLHRGARYRDVVRGIASDSIFEKLFDVSGRLRQGNVHLSDLWGSYTDYNDPMISPLSLSEAIQSKADELLGDSLFGRPGPVAIVVGAGLGARAYPVQSWGEVVRSAAQHGPVILVGSASEKAVANEIVLMTGSTENQIVNLCGQTDPAILAGVLHRCRLAVGTDTGPLHVAALVGTKCLGLYYGSMGFRQTGPYGPGHLVIAPRNESYPSTEDEMRQNPALHPPVPATLAADAVEALLTSGLFPEVEDWQILVSSWGQTGLNWSKMNEGRLPPPQLQFVEGLWKTSGASKI